MAQFDKLSYNIIGTAYEVHSELGPGLLESIYEVCLIKELTSKGYDVVRQKPINVFYKKELIDVKYRLDLLVEDEIIVELKSVSELCHIHTAQLITYLKLANKKTGILLNFNVVSMKDGVRRIKNNCYK